jgi:hypothetical protein
MAFPLYLLRAQPATSFDLHASSVGTTHPTRRKLLSRCAYGPVIERDGYAPAPAASGEAEAPDGDGGEAGERGEGRWVQCTTGLGERRPREVNRGEGSVCSGCSEAMVPASRGSCRLHAPTPSTVCQRR